MVVRFKSSLQEKELYRVGGHKMMMKQEKTLPMVGIEPRSLAL